MKKIFFLALLFFYKFSVCQNYNVALINDSLKENANAVTRFEELKIIIKSTSKAIVKNKYVITILREAGADFAAYHNYYSKTRSLENISGHLYDATGKELKSAKKKDIGDFSLTNDGSLMTDTRYKHHNFYCTQYPYTVEYEDEQEIDGTFFLPSWHPISLECALEQSNFIVETPIDYLLRYKQIAYSNKPIIAESDGKTTYNWQVKNKPAVIQEAYQPAWDEINPAVYVSSTNFEIEKYKGEMSNWQNLGLFFNSLNSGRQELPDNVKQDVHTLTDKINDPKDKIKILYEYLQKNTRYISVQLGIGGIQTFDAKYVATKKYGDCKALSNYMISIFKEANLPAKYVLVKSGKNVRGMWEDFPSPSYFDHVIMCVPLQKDTTWLECTSQTESTGYMGSFTGNRKVLLMDDDGGHVVSTPSYKAKDNIQSRKINAIINEEGNLEAEVFTHYTGIQQEVVNGLMHHATEEEKKKYLNDAIDLPTYSVEKNEYIETKGFIPSVDEYLSIKAPNYASASGKRLFITPNIFNRSSNKFTDDKARRYDIQFFTPYIDVDTVNIKIPANYSVESIPKSIILKTSYGNYSISFNVKDDIIYLVRKDERNEGRFPRSEYEDVVNYFNEIYKADKSKIVLIKN
jgi:Domain of Unknown Function with PDB structure (DUF3857)/Transglutaminase-like superfamily